jgi:AcrR family transcriptional regulator
MIEIVDAYLRDEGLATMTRNWILGADRGAEALERILSEASKLVSRNGFKAFSIDALAATLHCSPATIYRRAVGKAAILEVLISQNRWGS